MELHLIHKKASFSKLNEILNLARNATANNLFKELKGKLLLVIFFLVFAISGYSQSTFSLGVSGGYNKSFNHLVRMLNTTDAFPDYNFGVDGILKINDRLNVRAEMHYSNLSFTQKYNTVSSDPLRYYQSKLAISYLDISPKIECRLFSIKKFDLFASTGFQFEFQMGKYERAYLANGDKSDNDYISNVDYTTTQAGVVGGLVAKYNVTQFMAITLKPEYTYFFDEFYSKNNYNMQRVGLNLGVEWKF
jgi:hypothetical protein